MADDIVLTIDAERPAGAERFFAAGAHLLELLDDLAETVSVEWTLSSLRIGSAISGLSAMGENRQEGFTAARSAVHGLGQIRAGDLLPTDWTPIAVGHAKDLVRSSGGHAKLEAGGNVVWLDQQLRDRLQDVTPWVREFYGSVRGHLTGVNVTRGNRASIRPHTGGRVVHVGFPTSLASSMRDGLLEFVEIEGMLRQNDEARTYYVAAHSLRIVEEPPISWRELRGFMPDLTGSLSTAEYLENIRGEE
ncbi:hypothetical protein LQF12_04355 [Ruania suaedae]|uniref:hypothetical protein n=1 Tax=Ruania suaedae TaxID=2897774 RepID=UPI001E4EE0F8|nr:hypothetical protein [Ruania suaedae]UFU03846.1 hypothetical protein LQF12_04355 [Ruania suaedae]